MADWVQRKYTTGEIDAPCHRGAMVGQYRNDGCYAGH
jgi:hypothetical protein